MSFRILLFESNSEYPTVPGAEGGGSPSRRGLDFHYQDQPNTGKTESSSLAEFNNQNHGTSVFKRKYFVYHILNPLGPEVKKGSYCVQMSIRTISEHLFQNNILFSNLEVAEATRKESCHCAMHVEVNII